MPKITFFCSDLHLGVNAADDSVTREKKIVLWLDKIAEEAESIYFLGDIFDYWFEYGSVIPKGFSYLFGKIRELRDAGIPMYYFTGNHDMWMFRYMEDEYGIPIYRKPIVREIQGKKVFLAHGDGIGPGDYGYKMIKKVFGNRACQWAFARIHPNAGLWAMKRFSHQSRMMTSEEELSFNLQREWTVQYAESYIKDHTIDYFIMGHRHLPIQHTLANDSSQYFNIGDWLYHYSYGQMKNGKMSIEFFETSNNRIYGS